MVADRAVMTAVEGLTIVELGRLLDDRELSAEELVIDTYRRLESVGAELNVVASSTAERALATAHAADLARTRGERSPLLGIPYGVKDIIDVRGSATTCGSAAVATTPARSDAAVVSRLDRAGAPLVAKLAVAAGPVSFAFRGRPPIGSTG